MIHDIKYGVVISLQILMILNTGMTGREVSEELTANSSSQYLDDNGNYYSDKNRHMSCVPSANRADVEMKDRNIPNKQQCHMLYQHD